ncbi:hypothetical protein K503DRAFT_767527 [Rhizopogon vinicolor AM-OR11-026]|uniref:Uncharacterized protein n=1 Tax=Rhizopogon vinicolor AM-OR11-026 TaxID=1314800 RepID=A0A1B7N9P8_9AGAM|nr:hypothetical protein K503DRAFT_767527 [Rhizopogon vinicolor AM-OR11-026]
MGHLWSLVREVFPPATQFNASDAPDMSGKVVLVTGANSGLGRETTRVCSINASSPSSTPSDTSRSIM